jgi:hypothetical protein
MIVAYDAFSLDAADCNAGASPHTYASNRGGDSTTAPREITIPIGSSLGNFVLSNSSICFSPKATAFFVYTDAAMNGWQRS